MQKLSLLAGVLSVNDALDHRPYHGVVRRQLRSHHLSSSSSQIHPEGEPSSARWTVFAPQRI
jgi:hypothetical protein